MRAHNPTITNEDNKTLLIPNPKSTKKYESGILIRMLIANTVK